MYQFSISLQSMEKSHWVLERSDFMFIPLQKHKALGICQWNSNLLWLLEFQRLNFMTRIKYKLHSSFCMKLGLEGSWMWNCQAAVVPNSRFTRSRAELVFLVHGHTHTHTADTASHWQSNIYRRVMSLQAPLPTTSTAGTWTSEMAWSCSRAPHN